MKRLLTIIPLLLMLCRLAPGALAASPEAGPEIAAPSAVLIEKETGRVLYEKGRMSRARRPR